jgi:hypothetical protein
MISGFECGVNEICHFLDFTQRRLVVSCRRFGKFSRRCWWRFKSSGTFRPVFWLTYLHLQGQQFKMKALHSTETSVTLHQSTEHNLHEHVCENVVSQNRRPCYCVWRAFYGHVKITAASTKALYWTYFSVRALWNTKTLVNTNKCIIL